MKPEAVDQAAVDAWEEGRKALKLLVGWASATEGAKESAATEGASPVEPSPGQLRGRARPRTVAAENAANDENDDGNQLLDVANKAANECAQSWRGSEGGMHALMCTP